MGRCDGQATSLFLPSHRRREQRGYFPRWSASAILGSGNCPNSHEVLADPSWPADAACNWRWEPADFETLCTAAPLSLARHRWAMTFPSFSGKVRQMILREEGLPVTVTLHTDPVPLRVDETGTIRVGSSRVTLDVLLADYGRGMSPEEIARQLDTLELADVYGALEYYHRHREEIEHYLRQRSGQAETLRRTIEGTQPDRTALMAQLASRMAQEVRDHDSAPQ